MGLRYVTFRINYLLQTKLGLLKRKFPVNPEFKSFINLADWRKNTPTFFFKDRDSINLEKSRSKLLIQHYQEIRAGTFTFFSKSKIDLGGDYDWITNPITQYKYDITKHFTEIQDLSQQAGDIKYVWEKARFSFVYDIMRYDYHFEEDNAEFVLNQIENFIDKNPINLGPNYKCSQETSLRILNWTFALYFYKNSADLSEKRFSKILNSIYWQLYHVYKNIHFSRIAVRNNHAITETMMLYLSHLLFPFMEDTKLWSKKGKKWFEQEIAYQIYDDGTFLQYSMNYHRVVVQLLTWGIRLTELNELKLEPIVYEKAQKSLEFLDQCLNPENGCLPNYGSNDGALFFKLSDDDFRDYRSQLDDLRAVLHQETAYNTTSYSWYGIQQVKKVTIQREKTKAYSSGGYYLYHDNQSKTFIHCGAYKDRPAQADNLHLDIWVNGENYIWDTGSYKYNTTSENLDFFMGSKGHNTLTLNGKSQMLKGSRFIWYYWMKKAKGTWIDHSNKIEFQGSIEAFKWINTGIFHHRNVVKSKNELIWQIEDVISKKRNTDTITQHWHINPKFKESMHFEVKDEFGVDIAPQIEEAYVSNYYGVKELSFHMMYQTDTSKIYSRLEIIK